MNAAHTDGWWKILSRIIALAALVVSVLPSPAQPLPTRLGDLDADGQPTVLDLVRLINHLNVTNGTPPGAADLLPASLLPYADVTEDGLLNQADVDRIADAILGLVDLPNPYASPVVNVPVTATNGSTLLISGVARPHRQILITGGRFAVFAAADSNGLFSTTVDLRPNQLNHLFVTASSSNFPAGTPQPLRIIQDSQPPSLYIDFPTNGQTLFTSNTVIAGRVGDMLSGFMGLDVRVHSSPGEDAPAFGLRRLDGAFPPGQPQGANDAKAVPDPKLHPAAALQSPPGLPANVNVGIGNNGTFERNVPLELGTNLITVTAADIHGNSTTRTSTIHRIPLTGPRILALSGDMQMTNIGRRLAQPIVLRVTQADGTTPFANKLVDLQVTRNDGRLLPVDTNIAANPAALTNDITRTPGGIMHLQLFTDANGEARAWWTLGGAAGCGNNRVCVTSAGVSNAAYFCASAAPAPVKQINIGTGNNQKAETGAFVTEPLRAWVSDSCNGVHGIPITFTVVQGGGRLFPSPGGEGQGEGGSNSLTIASSRTGHAEALLQLGPDSGQNLIEATYPGNPGLPATFIAYGVARDPARLTSFTGLVLDNTSHPIGGVYCELQVGGLTFTNTTDTLGRFIFTNTPAGHGHLHVDGFAATNLGTNLILPGSFPSLAYAFTLVPNAENSLPTPVLLPRLNPKNARLYDGTTNLVLTCEGIDGLKMTIHAGSMRKVDGSLVTPANPALVALNQVHHDNVPMPMPDGASPPFAWTLQPGGAHFDPPITIEYPNMSGLPAGGIAYFLSFNHDTERFEIVASGHVSDDSATIVTDPGAGLSIAGWGCNCPPYSVTGECKKCCQIAVALFQGGPGLIGSIIWSSGSLNPLYRAIRRLDPNHVFAQVFGSSSTLAGQEDPARTWIQGLQIDGCPPPITVLIGHSLGGDTVNLSSSIASDLRVAIDPISRARALNFLTACEFYQRDLTLVGLADVNFLSADIASAQELADCRMPGCTSPSCLRGYHVGGAAETEIPGTDHSSVVGSVQPAIVGYVRSLLPAPALPPGGFAPAGDSPESDVFLDASFTLSIGGQGVQAGDDGSFSLRNISAPDQFGPGGPGTAPDFVGDDYVRLTGQSTAGGTNRYVFSEFFQLGQGQTRFINNLTFTDIPPRKPESLTIVCTNRILRLGEPRPLEVLARFADGTTLDVASRARYSTYRTSNPKIATVSPDGVVTPLLSGVVYVTAGNEGVSAVCGLNVVKGTDGLTTVTGTVVDTNGLPIAGATVRIFDLLVDPVTTGPDGRFSFSNVPTTLGPLAISVRATVDGHALTAFARVDGVSGGLTALGNLVASIPATADPPRFVAVSIHTVALRADRTLWAWGYNDSGQLGNGTFTRTNAPQPIQTNATWQAVAAGHYHTVALRADGTLWAWGENGSGQLGNGTLTDANTPQPIQTNATWQAVAAGFGHTVAVRADGTLWAWGENGSGQLGNGTLTDANTPQPIQTNATWQAVAAGFGHTVAVRADGTLWAWGENGSGQLGNGTLTSTNTPQRIGTNTTWQAVVTGSGHTVAVQTDGTLWAWGWNGSGQLGNGTLTDANTPQRIGTNTTWQTASAGERHTVAVRADGTLWAWGHNQYGQLGNGTFTRTNTPQSISTNATWQAVAAGVFHTVALSADGTLWAWGDNLYGQLGNGTVEDANTPQPIQTNATWQAVAAGDSDTVAVQADGTLWAWGSLVSNGTFTNTNTPQRIGTNTTWQAVAARYYHTVALRADGTLWAWGANLYGQLGNGTFTSANTPQLIQTNATWQAVAAGFGHTVAVRADGTLWTWGYNGSGQLGNGTFADANTPQPIQTNATWQAVAAGFGHTVAVRADGTLWAWGANSSGQLGNGMSTTFGRTTPQQIGTNTTWQAVAAGSSHTVALRADGTLWAWGANFSGQLGNGTLIDANTPQRIGTNTTWQAVAAGDDYTVALRADGTLWAWGANFSGQLGNGTFTSANTPQQIGTNATWQAVTAGDQHTVALRADGTLWAWGDNGYGQIAQPVPWLPAPVLGGAVWGPPP